MQPDDNHWMQYALNLAQKAQDSGEVPIGAVVIDANGKLCGEGYNQVITANDPLGHAEVIALRAAATMFGNYRLQYTTLYVTLEPCVMCAGAMIHARIGRLVFGTRDLRAGAAGSVFNLLRGDPLNHQVQIDEGVCQQACARLLRNFFQNLRSD